MIPVGLGRARWIAGLLSLGIVFVFGCAEVQPPSGGEPDKRAPHVDSTLPANGSVSISPDKTIDIYFSERVLSGNGRQVYIFPRPATEPRLKWHSNRLTISLTEPFPDSQTTVVTLGSGVTDLHNNRLDSSMTIAFSTGPTLDSGRVSGLVIANGAPQAGMMVGLWNSSGLTDTTVLDSLFPDYVTTTDSKGRFVLKYLPDREYRLIAFGDRNKDDLFNSRKETFALPDRPIVVGGEITLDSLVLNVASVDTSGAGILSANYTQSGMLKVRFSGEYPLTHLRSHLSNARLTLASDSTVSYQAADMIEVGKTKSSSITLAYDSIPAGDYHLTLPLLPDSSVTYESVVVKDVPDKEPPSVVDHSPGDRPLFASAVPISLTFSEPIDTGKMGKETVLLVRSDSLPVATVKSWSDRMHLGLVPDTILGGSTYSLRIAEFEIFDLAGNPMGDSLTTFSFKTLNADSLGQVSGTVATRLRDRIADPVTLIFREISNKYVDTVAVKGKEFAVDLPAGKYLLSGYIDSDRDGKRTDGSLRPFRLGETSIINADTIAVRARFETTGIEVTFR